MAIAVIHADHFGVNDLGIAVQPLLCVGNVCIDANATLDSN